MKKTAGSAAFGPAEKVIVIAYKNALDKGCDVGALYRGLELLSGVIGYIPAVRY